MSQERPPLEEMTLRQLRRVASDCGVSRYSRMRKDQLLAAIQEIQVQQQGGGNPQREMAAQETVEAAKFDVGQDDRTGGALASVDEGLADLPGGYGESRIVLMPRDPQWAYAYWDIPYEAKAAMRRQGGQQLALRIYDVTDVTLAFQSPHSIQEYPCDEMAREWYLPIPVSDRDYVIDIGYRCVDGRWLMLARSATVRIPPIYPSDWIEDYFLTVPWEEELQGKTFATLTAPGTRPGLSDGTHDDVYELAEEAEAKRLAGSIYGSMQQVPGSGQQIPGSGQQIPGSYQQIAGSMQQAPSSYEQVAGSVQHVAGSGQQAVSSYVLASGAGMWASGQTVSGVGMTTSGAAIAAQMSGVGMSGVGMGAQMSGVGMSGVGMGAQMSGVGMSGVGMGAQMSGVGMSGVGMGAQMSGVGMSGVGMGAQMSGVGMSGVGMTMSGVGMSGVGMGAQMSGVGMSGVGMTMSGVGMSGVGMGAQMSGVGMSGVGMTMSGVGMSGVGMGAQMSGVGMSGVGMSGVGMTMSGVGMSGVGMGAQMSGVGMSGVGMNMSGVGMSGIGMAIPTMSGVGMSGVGMGTQMSGVGMSGVGMTMSGVGMSGVGFSGSLPVIRPRKFWLIADAELIVYGATEPDATVTIGGRPIKLNPDGTFRFQMSFQDGLIDYPIMAVSADGEQMRAIHMKFVRDTPERYTNTKEEAVEEWLA